MYNICIYIYTHIRIYIGRVQKYICNTVNVLAHVLHWQSLRTLHPRANAGNQLVPEKVAKAAGPTSSSSLPPRPWPGPAVFHLRMRRASRH